MVNKEMLDTPLALLTVGQFLEIANIRSEANGSGTITPMENDTNANNVLPQEKYVYGIKGLESLLHVSRSTAKRILKSTVIDDAVTRVSPRNLIIDAEHALSLLHAKRRKIRARK